MSAPADVRIVRRGIPELTPMVRTGSENAHVSTIIRSLCIKMGHFAPDDEEGERDYTLMELGSAFERALVNALAARYVESAPDRYVQPGELELDGLIGTPDLLDLDPYAINEIKLTKLSSRQPLDGPKFWKYWVQLMAYCRMAETTRGYLHVCFLNGDYRENRSPDYRVYECNFTIDELKRNWRMLKVHQARMTE